MHKGRRVFTFIVISSKKNIGVRVRPGIIEKLLSSIKYSLFLSILNSQQCLVSMENVS